MPGHPCNPADWYLQCALLDQQPPVNLFSLPFGIQQGVDFAWGGPSCTALQAGGWRFGASYFSFDSSKNWQAGAVGEYRSHGCGTVGVWETTATRALDGFSAGRSDATEAERQARAVGNSSAAIDFAIDCDCVPARIQPYFQGAHSVLGSRTNAYGGYWQVGALCQAGLVGRQNWQTYAWSAGQWLPASCAPLEQWSNNHLVAGRWVDFDRALLPDYGQWPEPNPPPAKTYCFGRRYSPHHHARICDTVRPQVSRWSHTRDAAKRRRAWANGILKGYRCQRPYRRGTCVRAARVAAEQRHWERVFGGRVRRALGQYG